VLLQKEPSASLPQLQPCKKPTHLVSFIVDKNVNNPAVNVMKMLYVATSIRWVRSQELTIRSFHFHVSVTNTNAKELTVNMSADVRLEVKVKLSLCFS
jgi:hypothetical protein